MKPAGNNRKNRKQTEALRKQFEELKQLADEGGMDLSDELALLEEKIRRESGETSPWERVEMARHLERPGALDYIRRICDTFMECHGDRAYGDDPAMVGGIGTVDGCPITFIGNQKGANMKENLYRNYGMAHPEGYRKALRLAKQAEKFRRPIVTLIDTPGAYPGLEAEERGIGEAIARNLWEFSQLQTPILCIIIGEGGSGGALGLGVGDKIYMLETAVYSVLSPEGCASIMLRDSSRAQEAAGMMKLTSEDLLRFHIVNGVIEEPEGGAHRDPDFAAAGIKKAILGFLDQTAQRNPAHLVRYRNKKIREIGRYQEKAVSESI